MNYKRLHFLQEKIYQILAIKKYDEERKIGKKRDIAKRSANIYAVKYTVECWQRHITGKWRNVFNPERWE